MAMITTLIITVTDELIENGDVQFKIFNMTRMPVIFAQYISLREKVGSEHADL